MKLRDNMHDLLTMSRSFGSFFLLLTQNITTAVGDPRLLKILYTNIRWACCLRGDPADCAFLEPSLPITGRKAKPRVSAFDKPAVYTVREERRLLLDEIAQLPDRTGYLWFKSRNADAIRITTAELAMPHGSQLEAATQAIQRNPALGVRFSRKAYEQLIAERDKRWQAPVATDIAASLADQYRQSRGTRGQ